MIIVNLRGGLGNQLFQIFACINYSKNNYFFNDTFFQEKNQTVKRNTYWNNFFSNLNNRIFNNKTNFKLIGEEGFYYSEIPKELNFIILNGYYQSYKYFDNNYEDICKIIGINEKKIECREKYKYDYDNLCSIHFRYGDYKNNPNFHTNLDINYFRKATEIINNLSGINSFLVFFEEEDREKVVKILDKMKNKNNFILIDTTIPDYEQVILMSNCSHNIIANSSFSWWGAYFNDNPQKIVVRPIKWFGPAANNLNTSDLCPDEWISL